MRVALRQAPDSALVFTVESRLAQPVEYNLLAVSADDRLYRPPVQTLQPGRTATERWTRAVAQVAMADFRPAIVGLRAPSAAGNAPLLADRRLHLPLGSSVTVRLAASADGELEPRITRTGRAEDQLRDAATAAMAAQAAKTQRETGDQERFTPLLGPAGVQREGPGADEVRFTFGRGPDGRSLLLIAENGHGRVLNYQAALRFADGRRAPTTVCRVDEGSLMIETWSGQVAELELEDFELLDPRPEPSAQGDCD